MDGVARATPAGRRSWPPSREVRHDTNHGCTEWATANTRVLLLGSAVGRPTITAPMVIDRAASPLGTGPAVSFRSGARACLMNRMRGLGREAAQVCTVPMVGGRFWDGVPVAATVIIAALTFTGVAPGWVVCYRATAPHIVYLPHRWDASYPDRKISAMALRLPTLRHVPS